MTGRRVAVTGLGVVSPLGNTVAEAWSAAVAGKSGIAPITTFDTTGFAVTFAGQVRDFDAELYMERKEARRCDEFIQYGIAAGVQAIADAGLRSNPDDAHRYGFAVGSGIGGINNIEKTRSTLEKGGPRRVSPFFVPGSIANMIGGHLSIMYGYQGPNIAVVTACTTGTHNIGMAARMIQHGDADVMVVGGAEFGTSPTSIAGFCNMKALSTRNDDPEAASRPWDKDRDGFVLGDGAGVLVLEEYERAEQRGASIYAEFLGFGMSADAYHITSPREDGAGGIACMENAIADAGLGPGDIDYINAHGTSTPLGDVAETKMIKQVFGDDARLPVSSTKSMTGHLLGAAGSVEAIFTILALRDQICPPTINLHSPGDGCDLDYVPNEARSASLRIGLSNSFGFGGTNGTVIFGAV
ncbi:MAG: beta-ketoacyl-ACP synthase II [Gammaproteobacteria bacterium]|nr:beta-ketoacyl-ACP synthase II [Gammaproteobacteria bacterium]MDE0272421.1 beta-ketoacyl-ACP synthase II [Gammaproteobacteria bacterium]